MPRRSLPSSIDQSSQSDTDTLLPEEPHRPKPITPISSLAVDRQKASRRYRIVVGVMAFFFLTAAALFQALSALAQSSAASSSTASDAAGYSAGYADSGLGYDTPGALQQILASNESRWRYSTDFTRGIVPVCRATILKTLECAEEYVPAVIRVVTYLFYGASVNDESEGCSVPS